MKFKNLLVSFLIVIMLTVHVMPFNIIHADEQTPNFGKIFLDNTSIPFTTNSSGNQVDFSITGSGYLYGYYNYNYGARIMVLSSDSFTTNPANGGNPYQHDINGHSFYMNRNETSSANYSPYTVISGFPQYTQNNNDIPNSGDYAYDFLGPSAFVLPTKYNANQSFYSWTTGSNPYTITCSSDVYVIGFAMGNMNSSWTSFHVYFFTEEDATLEITRASGSITPTKGSTTYKGININYYLVSSWNYNPNNYTYTWNTNLMKSSGATGWPNSLHLAYNIYINEIYEEPEPPITAGDVVANFYTKYAGSGLTDDSQTWRENLDVIQWSNYDSLGQFINDYGLIEIRAVPGYFVGLSNASLLNQIYSDFVLDNELVSESYLLNPSDQEFTRKWGNMVNDWTVDIPFFSLTNYYRNEKWYKDGWIWQIRIVDIEEPDTPLTEWQTIYNSTSYSGNDGLNNPSLNTDSYDTFQEINNINNVTNNNWYINNVPVGVDTNTPTSDGTWIEKLIESITNLIGTIIQSVSDIIKAIAGFGSDIIQGIFDLISDLGVNILDTFTNLWNGFIDLFNEINFTDDNSEFDLDLDVEEGDSPLDIVPAFVRMLNSSGLGYMLWLPLVVGIVFMIL